ncbi:hypothetical protein WA556_004343 [Blastocystis sp. ATCC 50177/Nand II]
MLSNLKKQNLSKKEYEERKNHMMYQLNVQKKTEAEQNSKKSGSSSKLKLNYVMIIALIGEFSSSWLATVCDVTFAEFGEAKFGMTSSLFSLGSAIGAIINIFQTGWLFNKLISHNVSIPLITSLTGVCGAIGIVWCLTSPNLTMALIGSLFFLMAYGCAAPTAPAIMSTESTEATQGVALSMVLIGGQSAYILAPNILGALFSYDMSYPFLVSLIPCIAVFIAMLILHFIPGGKTAGQVPLRLALESLMKEEKMQGVDNEHEMEVLARTQHTEVEHKKEENDSALDVAVDTKKKEHLDNADDRYLMSMEEDGLDENGLVMQPRVNIITLADRLNSGSIASLHSIEGSQMRRESSTGNQKDEASVHIPESSEEEEVIAI